ncbi:hypothetical protein ACIRU5_24080 [Streptomyces misionensis]|uniref:hypothetical protein n=1 Tax=Streptomyces misionensis TaxID=67331 RepID=UPI0037F46E83
MDSLVFDSQDLAETEDFLCQAYARMSIGTSTPKDSRARIRRDAMPSVSVDELDLGFDMSYAVTPLGRICLCMVHEGTVQDHAFQGVRDNFRLEEKALVSPAAEHGRRRQGISFDVTSSPRGDAAGDTAGVVSGTPALSVPPGSRDNPG